MTSDVETKVMVILRRILGRELEMKDFTLPRTEISEWNSLAHVEIIFSCEDFFQIEFSSQEMSDLNSVNELVESISEKLK